MGSIVGTVDGMASVDWSCGMSVVSALVAVVVVVGASAVVVVEGAEVVEVVGAGAAVVVVVEGAEVVVVVGSGGVAEAGGVVAVVGGAARRVLVVEEAAAADVVVGDPAWSSVALPQAAAVIAAAVSTEARIRNIDSLCGHYLMWYSKKHTHDEERNDSTGKFQVLV